MKIKNGAHIKVVFGVVESQIQRHVDVSDVNIHELHHVLMCNLA